MIPKKVLDILAFCIDNVFYGEITIKFQAGKISHVERKESIKI